MPRVLSPRARALAILTGLNFLNYVDRFIPAAVMPSIIAALHLKDSQAGSLSTLFILTYSLISPVAGWLGDRQPRFQLAAVGVFVWSAGDVRLGAGPDLPGAGGGARAHRRRRGELHGRHAVAALRLLPAGPPRTRAGDLLRRHPDRLGAGLRPRRRRSTRTSAGGGRSSWRARPARRWRSPLLFLRDPPRGALDVGAGRWRRGAGVIADARVSAVSRGAAAHAQLRLQHGGADHLHLRGRAGWRPGCRPTSCACATCRSPPRT